MVIRIIMQPKQILALAQKPHNAIAIGFSGLVNAKQFPMLEYDKKKLWDVVDNAKLLQARYNLHRFFVYKTHNGFHVRFYYDHLLRFSKIKKIVYNSDCDLNYKKIVLKTKHCINRATGKYTYKDIKLILKYGKLPTNEMQKKAGDSIQKIFELVAKKPIVPLKYLIRELEK